MFTPNKNQLIAARCYRATLAEAQAAISHMEKSRDIFCRHVPVGAEVDGLRHVRVHNLVPKVDKIKAANLWRAVARMQVDIAALRKATKTWTVHDLRKIAKIVTHHRVLDVKASTKKGGK